MKNCIAGLSIKDNKATGIIIIRPYMLTKSTNVMNIIPTTTVMIVTSKDAIKTSKNLMIPAMIRQHTFLHFKAI